jgi:pimeloyl-ACP methyl ester carboxylesterase
LLLEDRLNQFLHERGCLDHLKVYDHQGLDTLLKMNQFKYDFLAHPFIKPIKIIIGKHHTIRGVLALKPGMQKRPLVILRCGTFCDSEGGVGTSLILSHYYDSSPFHVLVLSNSTGLMAQMESGEFVTGGGSGASQVYDILKIIAKNPFASRIRGIHFVGVSLGGYEALQVGLMGDLMGQIDPNVAIKSSTAVCPAVDLSQSVRFVFDGGRVEPRPNISQRTSFFAVVKNHFLRSQFFLRRLRDGGPLHVSPENWWTLPSYGQRFYELKFDLVYDFFNRILFPDLNSPDGYRLYQPFMGISHLVSKRLGDLGEDRHEIYRALENYLDFHNHTHETNIPTHLLYSNDDWIVPSEFNGKSLASQVKQNRLKGKQNRGHNFLSFTETPLGSHCAQSISYRYDHLTQIYTASIMNAYEEAERDGMFETHSLSLNGFGTQGEQLRSTFSAPVKHVEYNFRVISEDIIQVNLILRRSQSEEAKYQFALDYDVLTTTDPDLTGPFNQVHSEALTRWANGNIVLTDQQGADIRVSLKPPAFVQWLGSKI